MRSDYRGEPGDKKWLAGLIIFVFYPAVLRLEYLKKAGIKAYKSLIPFYGTYKTYELFFNKRFFPVYVFLWLIKLGALALEKSETQYLISNTADVLIFLGVILPLITGAKKFGKSRLFRICTLLMPPVFVGILAFGKSKYLIKKEKKKKKKKKKPKANSRKPS